MTAKPRTQDQRLDAKDLKILRELERDARQSFGEIAKKAGMSKEVVLYRVRNMENSGIIRGHVTEIDLYGLGYRLYPVLLKLEELSVKDEAEITDHLKRSQVIGWAAWCEGTWDLNIVLRTKNAGEVAGFFDDFEKRFGSLIVEKALMHTVSLDYFKRAFGEGSERRGSVRTQEVLERIEISEKEERLLKALAGNARMPIGELSKTAGVSPPTVISMIRRMEQQGIIQGYRVFTDFAKRGHLYYKVWLTLKGMDERKWKELYSYLGFNPHVLWATRTIGYYDFSIEMEVPDVEGFRGFVAGFRERFHGIVKRRDSFMVSKELGLSYYPGAEK